ncbi:MAG: hypothetical protein JWN99_1416 [Ilumatobacteraceae bacterium]|nr:hypothetical protein [Ilumatobacteraceae bacterium]
MSAMTEHDSLSTAIRCTVDPLSAMRRLVEQALLMIDEAQGAAIELLREGRLSPVYGSGMLGSGDVTGAARTGMGAAAIEEGTTQRCDDTELDLRVDKQHCRRLGVRSLLCVPLINRDRMVGVLKVCSAKVAAFDDEDVATLNEFAEFVSSVVASAADVSTATDRLLDRGWSAPKRRCSVSRFVANVVAPEMAREHEAHARIEAIIADQAFSIMVQPIVDMVSRATVGYECLARFPGSDYPPNTWFAEAHRVGLGLELELAVAARALALRPSVQGDLYLAVNVGPQLLADRRFSELLDGRLDHVVFEVTEHDPITDYAATLRAVQQLRDAGALLAVDDTGTGFASLTYLLRLAPDIVKLDRELTIGISADPVRQALATALVVFCNSTNATVVAEGVEDEHQVAVLTRLGVGYGQGFHLGRPQSPEQAFGASNGLKLGDLVAQACLGGAVSVGR